jgi:hypothetical protein
MTAPVASGWSGCQVGLAPTGTRRVVTAHTSSGHSDDRCSAPAGSRRVDIPRSGDPERNCRLRALAAEMRSKFAPRVSARKRRGRLRRPAAVLRFCPCPSGERSLRASYSARPPRCQPRRPRKVLSDWQLRLHLIVAIASAHRHIAAEMPSRPILNLANVHIPEIDVRRAGRCAHGGQPCPRPSAYPFWLS